MRNKNIKNKSTSYLVSLMALICGIGCVVALVLSWSVNSTTGLDHGKATETSEVLMFPADYMNSGSIRNAPPEVVALTIPLDSRSTVSLRDTNVQQGNGIKLEVPGNTLYTDSMLNNSDDLKIMKYTDIVYEEAEAVREISDDNRVDFQTNLSLFLEGLEEDVLDKELPHSLGPAVIPKTVDND